MEYEIVTAIDGRDLDPDDPRIGPPLRDEPDFRPSLAACALSHELAHKRVLASGDPCALVLEDDVELPADLARVVSGIAAELSGAEVALLNYDSQLPCRLRRSGMTRLPEGRALAPPLDVHQPSSGAAYLITRAACERMGAARPPVRTLADAWGYFCETGLLERVRCVVPLVVLKSPLFESTLGYNAEASLKSRLLRLDLPLLRSVVAFRRRRIFRKWTRIDWVDEAPGCARGIDEI